MMTQEEKQTFKELFSKYCRQEMNLGHCQEDCCELCPVNQAWDEIFVKFAEDDEDDHIDEG